MLEKMERVIMLKDLYGSLLTEKQAQVLAWHYEQDLSLSEIAEQMEISKQAVYDLLRRSENTLNSYERHLGLMQRFKEIRQELEEVCSWLEGNCDHDTHTRAVQALRTLLESM
ncbi:MAG: YlxM family DNA-binding protein [Syntrophomonadaceae bacterium]|nr:YlxM family DNA-binding protein [Syntrophomonadaceae bacterium]